MMVNQHGIKGVARVVDQFEATDLGAPFKVILKDSVRVVSDEHGEVQSYTIPDPDGLLRVVAMTRVLHPQKLSGADIRFLRKAVGIKQKDLARAIELTPEHMSKVEADTLPIGPGSEKLLRIFLFNAANKEQDCGAKDDLGTGLDQLFNGFTPVAVRDASLELVLAFHHRSAVEQNGADDGCWDKLAA